MRFEDLNVTKGGTDKCNFCKEDAGNTVSENNCTICLDCIRLYVGWFAKAMKKKFEIVKGPADVD